MRRECEKLRLPLINEWKLSYNEKAGVEIEPKLSQSSQNEIILSQNVSNWLEDLYQNVYKTCSLNLGNRRLKSYIFQCIIVQFIVLYLAVKSDHFLFSLVQTVTWKSL